jgi:hypothetical protein
MLICNCMQRSRRMETLVSDDDDVLAIGAEAIAQEVFEGKLNSRQVYRWASEPGAPVFKVRGKIATWVRRARRSLGQAQAHERQLERV